MFDNNNQEILEKKWETTIIQALKHLPPELRNVIHTSLKVEILTGICKYSFLVHNNKNNAKVKMLPLKKVEWTYRYFKETCSATCIQIMNSLKCTGR